MCPYERYHTVLAGEIEAGDFSPRERHEELEYDMPWRVLAIFTGVVTAFGVALSLLIGALV